MGHEIRKYMARVDGDTGLSGHVEVDESMIGGKRKGPRGRGARGKTVVFGMLERQGDVMTKVVADASRNSLNPIISENVAKGSVVSSDEWHAYKSLGKDGYQHGTVEHGAEQYVNGIHHVNSIEGFWSRLKNSIRGTHIHVSKKHLPKYLGEFEYRYNMRANPSLMFDRLLRAF